MLSDALNWLYLAGRVLAEAARVLDSLQFETEAATPVLRLPIAGLLLLIGGGLMWSAQQAVGGIISHHATEAWRRLLGAVSIYKKATPSRNVQVRSAEMMSDAAVLLRDLADELKAARMHTEALEARLRYSDQYLSYRIPPNRRLVQVQRSPDQPWPLRLAENDNDPS